MHIRSALLALVVLPGFAGAQALEISARDPRGIYPARATIGWTIALAPGETASTGAYTYTVKENGARVMRRGVLDLAHGTPTIETTLDHPGMILVEIRPPSTKRAFGDASTGGPGRILLGAAVDPTKIQRADTRPADFDAFWAAQLDALQKVPMNAVVTPKETTVPNVELATVRLNNVGGAHVYANLAKPKGEGKFPALVIYQWASAPYPLPYAWVTDRAAQGWLTLNVEPHDVPTDMPQPWYDALPQMIKGYASLNDTDRDHNYFRQMYLGDYRAIEYLASRPDWDGKTMVVMGISMGGQQSLAMAGLNPRVTAAITHVAAGSDALAAMHERMAGYPNWNVKNPLVAATAPYFDVTNFASRITAPTLIAMGFIDEVCPSIGLWTTFNQIPGVKEAVPLPEAHHNHLATAAKQAAWTTRATAWLTALAKGERAPVMEH
ncbi:MAG: acetylxylan esterase [Gemmatimonadaceae bacterium]